MDGDNQPEGQADVTRPQEPRIPRERRSDDPSRPATAQQLQQTETRIEDRMSAFERSMIRLTLGGIGIAIVTGIIFAGQLYEMIEGGTQTDKLVSSAGTQAAAATNFSKSADSINVEIQGAVTAMKDNAAAAKSSAETARKVLASSQTQFEIENRPYIYFMPMEAGSDLPNKFWGKDVPVDGIGINIGIANVGRTAAVDYKNSYPVLVTTTHPDDVVATSKFDFGRRVVGESVATNSSRILTAYNKGSN